MKLVVDPWHWLDPDGGIPHDNLRLRKQVLRVARLIEYGGPLERGTVRETLVECSCRPGRKLCPGLLWVEKLADDSIFAHCLICGQEEIHIHNWKETDWADGPMDAAPAQREGINGSLH